MKKNTRRFENVVEGIPGQCDDDGPVTMFDIPNPPSKPNDADSAELDEAIKRHCTVFRLKGAALIAARA